MNNLCSFSLNSLEALRHKAEHGKIARGSGTTILAFYYKDGVIMAADRRMTSYHTHDDTYVKIVELKNNAVMGCAGTVSFIQDFEETFVRVIDTYQDLIGAPIYVDGQAQLAKVILKENFQHMSALILLFDFIAVPIIAGFDPFEDRGKIFEYDGTGGMYEKDYFATVGSGGENARVILEDRWKKGLSRNVAVDLAIRALVRASADNYTSPPMLAPVTVALVTKDGTQFVDHSSVLTQAWKTHLLDLKRRGEMDQFNHFTGRDS